MPFFYVNGYKFSDTLIFSIMQLLPKITKYLFSVAHPLLQRFTGEKKLHELYKSVPHDTFQNTEEFAEWVLRKMKIDYDFPAASVLQELKEIKGPIIFICNHPFSGIEAFVMIRLMAKIRPNYHILTRSPLVEIEELTELKDVIIMPKQGVSRIAKARDLLEAIQAGDIITLFPTIESPADTNTEQPQYEWDNSVAKIIHKAQATVIPVFFQGKKSFLFRFIDVLMPKLRSNLPAIEVLQGANKNIRFYVGKKISYDRIEKMIDEDENDSVKKYEELNDYLKSKLFLLSLHFIPQNFISRFKNIGRVPAIPLFGNNATKAETIIPPIGKEILAQEIAQLPENALLADNNPLCVYCLRKKDAPNVLKEIGRLREITFRDVGEGSGKACDLDEFDENYFQLVLWDKEKSQIAGGYRIGKIDELFDKNGADGIYLNSIFRIKERLLEDISDYSLELGRSYVVKEYQRSYQPLLMLWTGIAQFVVQEDNKKYKYLIGPVSISSELQDTSKTLIVAFLEQNNLAQNLQDLAKPKHKFHGDSQANDYFKKYNHTFAVEGMREINDAVTELEKGKGGIPILFKHYLKMGARMLAFNVDPDFSNVLDCLMVTDLTQTDRHLLTKYMGKEKIKEYLAYHAIDN